MSIAQHAERILAAWNIADPERFETELDSAMSSCKRKAISNVMEMEQQELLESVVERLRVNGGTGGSSKKSGSAQSLSAGFALLQHLSHRVAA